MEFFFTLGEIVDEKDEVVYPIRLKPETRETINAQKRRFGVTGDRLVSSLLTWLAGLQDDIAQTVIREGDVNAEIVKQSNSLTNPDPNKQISDAELLDLLTAEGEKLSGRLVKIYAEIRRVQKSATSTPPGIARKNNPPTPPDHPTPLTGGPRKPKR